MGPLAGLRVLEFAGLGPAPFCAMLLADLGAEVIRIARPDADAPNVGRVIHRNRASLALDIKSAGGREAAARLIERADVLLEGFRPGVMEKLGLGPEECSARNPGLVYGRMTGWGQHGPLASVAGHDINYIALSGALQAMGRSDEVPQPPLNLVGDFGGGGMLLAVGILAALLERGQSGKGQVVDAAMTDGSSLLMALMYSMKASGSWKNERGSNLLDGSAHFYRCYKCKDGKFIAVGALEPQFYRVLLEKCGLLDEDLSSQHPKDWAASAEKLETLFATRTREQWCELLEGSDACVAPVLDMDEAPRHPHNRARQTFVEVGGIVQPAPAPRFSRSRPESPELEKDIQSMLAQWSFDQSEIATLTDPTRSPDEA